MASAMINNTNSLIRSYISLFTDNNNLIRDLRRNATMMIGYVHSIICNTNINLIDDATWRIIDMYMFIYSEYINQIRAIHQENYNVHQLINRILRTMSINTNNYNNINNNNINNINNINNNNINNNYINNNNINNNNNSNNNNINNNYIRNNRTNNNINTSLFGRSIPTINPINYSPISSENPLINRIANFLNSNVIVAPTSEQILTSTRLVQFGNIVNPLSECCPISLLRFQPNHMVIQIRHCGHIFCEQELRQWFRSSVRCPVCRYDIRTFVPTDNENNYIDTNSSENINNDDNNYNDDHDDNDDETLSDDIQNGNLDTNTSYNAVPVNNAVLQHSNLNYSNEIINNILNSLTENILTNDINREFIWDASSNFLYYQYYQS